MNKLTLLLVTVLSIPFSTSQAKGIKDDKKLAIGAATIIIGCGLYYYYNKQAASSENQISSEAKHNEDEQTMTQQNPTPIAQKTFTKEETSKNSCDKLEKTASTQINQQEDTSREELMILLNS